MADQKIGVILDFKANTSQAKQSMAQLQQYLTQISSGANLKVNTTSIQTASKAAKELAYHLSAAYNADTGKLDLGKLNASLNSAKANIGDLSSRLLQAGTTGQQAFVQLAKSMSMAEAPAFRLNGVVTKLWTSLKNVATWQISSNVLMGFTSSISEAYQFAQDLNESLNDIRIVTGSSAEEMQRFAKEANKAAKALSTTTTKYTDASLIYFQQGLSEKEVKERTDLTIKMANVTGQSVSEVSDQLTSVWNNFDNGTKALEYYVDVMTALGAATASSSEEISEGLNKFAAVAETVGLSYEYAAAALATVTATTRQSADIVGTAFKTLFARIQDLELGETLDDGTTMGQYSQALAAVGIDIKDINGEIKDMNIILDEMGAKWSTLSKDTQIALAQNVAGVRQYTQLIALMDNWSYFQENLNTAYTSTGELQKQADIYAESWEAARHRVTASLEDIYQDVLKDDFFIDLLNSIADIIEGVDTFIEKLGGIEPIIIGLSSLLLNSISNKIQPAIYGVISSIRSITAAGAAKEAEKASQPMVDKIDKQLATGNYNQSDRTSLENSKQLLQVKNQLWARQKDMTDQEKQMAQIDLELIEKKQSELQTTADIITKMQEKISLQKEITIQNALEENKKKQIINLEEQLQAKVESTKKIYERIHYVLSKDFVEAIEKQRGVVQTMTHDLEKIKDQESNRYRIALEKLQEQQAVLKNMELERTNANAGLETINLNHYNEAQRQLKEFQTINERSAEIAAKVGQTMTEAYQKAGQAAAEAGEKTSQAFLEGKSTIGLNDISTSFFNDNKEIFNAVGTKKAYSNLNAKNALSSFRETLGDDVLGKDLTSLFNNAQNATSGKELKAIIEQIQQALKTATTDAGKFEAALKNFGDAGEQAVNDVKKPILDLDKKYKQLAKQQQELNAQVANFKPKHLATGPEIFAKMSSGITSTVMALNGLNAMAKQIKENGMPDTFEEWLSLMTSLTFVVPQVLNAYKGLSGGLSAAMSKLFGQIIANNEVMTAQLFIIDAQGKKIPKMTGAELYAAAAKKAGAHATEAQIKAEIAELAVSEGLIDATQKEAFSENILTAAKQKGTIWSKLKTSADNGSAVASKLLAHATKKGTITINEQTGAIIANNTAWYANPIVMITIAIVAATAAIAAFTIYLLKVNGILGKQKSALEIATENYKAQAAVLEELNENLEEANNRLNEVKETLEGYYEIQNAFDGLVQGSSAWNENLTKNNELVSDLLKKYPELASSVKYVNGVATLPEWAQQYIVGNATIESIEAQMAATMQDVNTRRAKNKMDEEADKAAYKQAKADGATLVAQHGRAVQNVSQNDDASANTITIGGNDYTVKMANGGTLAPGLDYSGWTSLEAEIFDNILDGYSKADLEQEYADTFEIIDGYKDVFDALYESAEQRINQWGLSLDAITKKYEEKELELLRYSQVQNKLLASQMLVAQQGFSKLNLEQQQAATAIIAQQLNFNQQMHDAIASGSMEGMQALAKQKNVFFGDWAEGDDDGLGVSNLLNTNFGLGLIEDYLKTNKGINIFDRENLSSDDGKLVYESDDENGEDIIFEASAVFAAAAADFAYATTDLQGTINDVGKITDSVELAKYTGDFTNLTEAEMASIGRQSGGDSTGYILNKEFENEWFKNQGYKSVTRGNDGKITSATAEDGTIIQDANQLALLAERWANVTEAARNYDYTLYESLRLQEEQAKIDSSLAQGAEELGIEVKTLELYMENIQTAYKTNAAAAAKTAIANAKYSKGIEVLGDTLGDNLYILNQWKKTGDLTAESAEALTEVIAALKDVFGVEVSSTFIQENLEKIQALTEGGDAAVEAMKELEEKAAKDYVLHLALEEDYKTQLNELIETLTAEESELGFTIGVEGDISKFSGTLSELLNQGLMTVEEMEGLFNSFGWSPQITEDTQISDPAVSITKIGEYNSEEDAHSGQNATSESWQRIETRSQIPVFSVGDAAIATPKTKSTVSLSSTSSSGGSKKKKIKNKSDEIDRYHEIKEELSDIENELDAISKAKDRAFGADKLKLIDKEIAKNKELLAAQEEYIKQIQEKAIEDQKAANAVGISTDESGRISNYDEIMGQAIDEYNAAVNALNSGNLDEAGFEAAEKKYENFIKVLNQYEETLNLLEDEQQKFTDNQNKIIDLGLEEVEYQVELKIKINDNDIKKLEWMLKKLDDPINDAAEAVEKLGQIALKNLSNLEAYKQGIKDTFAQVLSEDQLTALLENNDFSVLNNAELTVNQVSALEKYRDSLYDTSDALDEFYEQVMTKVNSAFEGYNKEMEEHIEEADRYKAVVETYLNVIDLVGKKTLGVSNETVKALRRAQYEATKTSVTGLKEQLAMNRDLLAQAAAERDKYQNDSEEYKYWDEQVNTIQEKVNSLESSIQSSWTDMLQEAADIFASSVEDVTSAFEEAMTGTYGTYEKMQKMFDQQKEISDRFVDNYKQVYELSKLNRDITKSMDSMDGVAGKEALRDLQEEINRLQESGAEMSEYDLEYLRKKYDLRVAEIALEEAQNAKSQVRMQRDAEGNWGYVYTADESKTADAEQNYEDKLYAIQEHSQSYMEEMEQKVIETEQRMLEEISGLRAQDFESEEAYQAEIDRITKYYTEQRSYYLDELNQAIGNSSEIYNNDWLAYEGYNGKKLEADRGWRDQFNETTLSQVGDYQSIEDARSKFDAATTNMLSSLTSAFGQWQIDVHDAFTAVGEDFKAFGGEDGTAATTANNATEKLGLISSEIESWGQKAVNSFADITKAVNDEFTNFQTAFAPYKEETQSLIDLINEALRLKVENETLNEDNGSDDNDTTGDKPGASTGTTTGSTGGGDTWDNGTYSDEWVKAAQHYVGTSIDGKWGEASAQAAAEKGLSSLDEVINSIKANGFPYAFDTSSKLIYAVNGKEYGQLKNGWYADMELIKDPNNQLVVDGNLIYLNPKKINPQTMDDLGLDEFSLTVEESKKYANSSKPSTSSGSGGGGGSWRGQFMTKMNTGGYTGAWGPEGRIAMLHEKELVLNPGDTANFLSAINIVRDIASLIDLHAAAQQSALSMMSATSIAPTAQTLQQEVTIHAEFPNATQRTEIEAAFDTLLNRASQFANRKNK